MQPVAGRSPRDVRRLLEREIGSTPSGCSQSKPAAAARSQKASTPIRVTIENETIATRGMLTVRRVSRIASKISSTRRFRASARVKDVWMTGPSAIESEYGNPISTPATPSRSSRRTISVVAAAVGKPAVTYGQSPLRPARLRSANF